MSAKLQDEASIPPAWVRLAFHFDGLLPFRSLRALSLAAIKSININIRQLVFIRVVTFLLEEATKMCAIVYFLELRRNFHPGSGIPEKLFYSPLVLPLIKIFSGYCDLQNKILMKGLLLSRATAAVNF